MPLTMGQANQLGSADPLADPSGLGAVGPWVGSLFTDTCTIFANQGGPDFMGGFGDVWNAIANYPCAVKELTPRSEMTEGARVTAIGIYEFKLPADAIVEPDNRILCNDVTYEVQDRDSRLSTQAFIKVRARRID